MGLLTALGLRPPKSEPGFLSAYAQLRKLDPERNAMSADDYMVFDPAICGWDRPGGVYRDGLAVFKKDLAGNFLWCRSPTSAELLWISTYGSASQESPPSYPEGFDASHGDAGALTAANAAAADLIGKRAWDVPSLAAAMLKFAQTYHREQLRSLHEHGVQL